MKKKKGWIGFHVTFVLLVIAAFVGMKLYLHSINNNKITYEMGGLAKEQVLTMEVSKNWSEMSHGYVYGMQYDGQIVNPSGNTLSDWVIELKFQSDWYIDSYWNGNIEYIEDGIRITPAEFNSVLEPGKSASFGMVMYANTLYGIKEGKVTFARTRTMSSLPAFWAWLLVILMVLVADVTLIFSNISNNRKTRQIRQRQKESLEIINQSLMTVANMIDAKDSYTQGHSVRVAIYSKEIAARMGFSEDEQNALFRIALVHDIGKIGIDDAVLKKTGKLTQEERRQIEGHVQMGGDILKDFTAIPGIQEGAMYHHERYDGKGYVNHLKGNEIPLYARIICVADAFDAMSSARCYRPALSEEIIKKELTECSGTQFDPKIAAIMLAIMEDGKAPVKDEDLKAQLALSAQWE